MLAALWLLNVRPLRKALISGPFMRAYRRLLPSMSQTEKEALEAGTVWWDGELFTGAPGWSKLLSRQTPALSVAEEQAFLDGPCEELCRMLDEWNITHERADLPPAGVGVPKGARLFRDDHPEAVRRPGVLRLRALVRARQDLQPQRHLPPPPSRCRTRLGPAELLHHYGTEEQKNHYLPRLARGEEVPCFALTGPRAGSDAGSIPDTGIVCRGQWQGREVVGLRLNFSKRYITLAPIATVIGLAFGMFDPEKLLVGEKTDRGITCALIPRNTPGVTIGRRHFPLNIPFQNGPIHGQRRVRAARLHHRRPEDGRQRLAHAGRAALGRALHLAALQRHRRRQGGRVGHRRLRAHPHASSTCPVGRFEGVETVIARMVGLTYTMDAARWSPLACDRRRRAPLGTVRHSQVPRHRDGPPRRQRRDGRTRRQGHLPRSE